MNEKDIKHKSKFLSLVLRHQPSLIHLELDKNGWANVTDLIEKSKTRKILFTHEILDVVVETNNKQRFTFNEDKTKIRANQGHSINIDNDLDPIKPPSILYHGTSINNVDSIHNSGIDKRTRQHVHLSHDKETARYVGSRHGKPYIFIIDARQMYSEGNKFYQSKNGVWLTEYVDPKYICRTLD